MSQDLPHEIPKRTTPTWDMELLISGATIFGLLQLPVAVDRLGLMVLSGNEMQVQQFLYTLTLYVQCSLLTLIATFVLHLILRAYWVALVGMNSVYPDGIRWDYYREQGPVSTDVLSADEPSFEARVDAADNRATWVFGLGFGLALIMVWPALFVGTLSIVLVIGQKFDWRLDLITWAALLVFFLLMVPIMVAGVVDRYFGARWLAEGRADLLKRVFRFYARLGMSRSQNPLVAIAQSHSRNRWATGYVVLAATVVMNIVAVVTVVRMGSFENGAYDGLPPTSAGNELELFPAHYGNQRNTDGTMTSPFIPSMQAKGPYLPLFLPYRPRSMNEALAKACPDALEREASLSGAGLVCMGRLLEPKLDDRVLSLQWFSAVDPASGQRGALAMIDIRELPIGQHRLKLRRLPIPEAGRSEREQWHQIEFWK
ncbi:MAG: hypothetical protein IPK97_18855 [Ahniella sp.]|nr:hypothetical protein [Ahniella sp.]